MISPPVNASDLEIATLILASIDRIAVSLYEKNNRYFLELRGTLAPLLGLQKGGIIGAQKRNPSSKPNQ